MKPTCHAFRTLLEKKLVGRPDPQSLTALSWHEHLLGCNACRALFEGEEALEALLATLPEPQLTPEIKRRVLVALARSKADETALDALLERDAQSAVPVGLARSVLERLEDERRLANATAMGADRLDALLDQDRVVPPKHLARRILAGLSEAREQPVLRSATASDRGDAQLDVLLERAEVVTVPYGLDRRVLAGLATHRNPTRTTAAPRRPFTLVRSPWMYAAAGLLAATLLSWALWRREEPAVKPDIVKGSTPRAESHRQDEQVATAPDVQMLAALDVLENWDLLMVNDVDVLLSTIEPADEVLLDYQDEG